jgi:hypothetical protein
MAAAMAAAARAGAAMAAAAMALVAMAMVAMVAAALAEAAAARAAAATAAAARAAAVTAAHLAERLADRGAEGRTAAVWAKPMAVEERVAEMVAAEPVAVGCVAATGTRKEVGQAAAMAQAVRE